MSSFTFSSFRLRSVDKAENKIVGYRLSPFFNLICNRKGTVKNKIDIFYNILIGIIWKIANKLFIYIAIDIKEVKGDP